MEPFPLILGLTFGAVTAFAVCLFYLAARRSGRTLAVLLAWLLLQTGLGLSGFYTVMNTIPPRFALLVGPPVLFIIGLLITPAGRPYLDSLRLEMLTLLHVARVPVELVLFALFLHHAVPQLMTFEGRNYDILSGLTAPLIYYLAFRRKTLGKAALIAWNFLCLGLLLNIVVNALLSAPSPIQCFAFEQPNVAILHFPFVWLPACVVPLVLLAHGAALRQLLRADNSLN